MSSRSDTTLEINFKIFDVDKVKVEDIQTCLTLNVRRLNSDRKINPIFDF